MWLLLTCIDWLCWGAFWQQRFWGLLLQCVSRVAYVDALCRVSAELVGACGVCRVDLCGEGWVKRACAVRSGSWLEARKRAVVGGKNGGGGPLAHGWQSGHSRKCHHGIPTLTSSGHAIESSQRGCTGCRRLDSRGSIVTRHSVMKMRCSRHPQWPRMLVSVCARESGRGKWAIASSCCSCSSIGGSCGRRESMIATSWRRENIGTRL